MRSRSPAEWIAAITERRSPATGACRASSPKACSSAEVRRASISVSEEMTSSARSRSPSSSALVAFFMASPANWDIWASSSLSPESFSW